jgi:hypothetical protein
LATILPLIFCKYSEKDAPLESLFINMENRDEDFGG